MTSLTFHEAADPPRRGMFFNRRDNEKYLKNVFPAGFVPPPDASGVRPPKFQFESKMEREFVNIVMEKRPSSRSPVKPVPTTEASAQRGIDEFRHVAGPYFRAIDFDDSFALPQSGPAHVLNIDAAVSVHSSSMNSSGILPILHKPRKQRIDRKKVLTGIKYGSAESRAQTGDTQVIKRVLRFQNAATDIHVEFVRQGRLLSGTGGPELKPSVRNTFKYNTPLYIVQKAAASLVLQDKSSKFMKGKFKVELQFFKESEQAWVSMNSEIQWIHAKSVALDQPDNFIKIMYEAVNSSELVIGGSLDADDSLLLDIRSRVDSALNHPSQNGLVEEQHSFVSSHHSESGASRSLMLNDFPSVDESFALTRHSLQKSASVASSTRSLNKYKVNAMATNLENRLTLSAKR